MKRKYLILFFVAACGGDFKPYVGESMTGSTASSDTTSSTEGTSTNSSDSSGTTSTSSASGTTSDSGAGTTEATDSASTGSVGSSTSTGTTTGDIPPGINETCVLDSDCMSGVCAQDDDESSTTGFCTIECDPQDPMSCDGFPEGNVVCSWEHEDLDPRYVCGLCSDTPACDPGCPENWVFMEAIGLCYPLAPFPYRDLYEPCQTDGECMSGICAPPFTDSQAVTRDGFCSIDCDPDEVFPCAHVPVPDWGPAICNHWGYMGADSDMCGVPCIAGCPIGWSCTGYAEGQNSANGCFPDK